MKGFIGNNVFPVLCAAALLLGGIFYGVTASSINSAQQDRATEMLQLEQQHVRALEAAENAQVELRDELTGADSDRAGDDLSAIEDMLSMALSWDDHDSYVDAREEMIQEYGLSQDSAFIQTFLPSAPVNTDGAGNEYPYIDAMGLNSAMAGFDAEVIGVEGEDYSYLIVVEVSVESRVGSEQYRTSESAPAVVFATVDAEGGITDLSGYPTAEEPRSSR